MEVLSEYDKDVGQGIDRFENDDEESPNGESSNSSSESSNDDPDEKIENTANGDSDRKYLRKCQELRRIMQGFFYENNALADELRKTNCAIQKLKIERKFLLEKLLQYRSGRTVPLTQSNRKKPRLATSASGLDKMKKLKREKERMRAKAVEMRTEERTEVVRKLQRGPGEGKRKRLKPGMVRRKLQPVPLDSEGYPIMPINLGGLTVHCLGRIVADRSGFHSERYIWPVGFVSTRTFFSMYRPGAKCVYQCRILDGKNSPLFEMQAADSPDRPIVASSATACHTTVLKQVNKTRSRDATNTGSGPEFFGFSHPVVMNILQNDSLCEKLEKFQRIEFDDPTGVQKNRIRMPPVSGIESTTWSDAPLPSAVTGSDVGSGSGSEESEDEDEGSSGNEADSDGTSEEDK